MSDRRKEIQRKVTIKQFEWYQVETKVRELLTQMLQPFIKKQTQQSIKINELKRGLNSATQKLQDHEFILDREDAKKPTYLQFQDDKIQDLNKKLNEHNLHQDQQVKQMKKILSVYEEKIKQLNNLETKLELQTVKRAKDLQAQQQHLNTQIDHIFKKLDEQDNQINNFRTNTRNNVAKLQNKTVALDNRLLQIQIQMKRRINQIKKIHEDLTKLHEKTEGHQIQITDLSIRISDREKDEKLSEKFFAKASQLSNDISFLRGYLTHYQPLYNQMQISQTLHSVLKDDMKIRLCVFEEKAYAKIHYKILNMEEDSLEERMSQFTGRIRRIVNNNKKYVIKLKVEQTVKYGTNIYQIRQIDQSIISPKQNQIDLAPPPVIIPEEQIKNIIQAKWEKILKQLQQTLKNKIQPLKIWVNQLQEQSLLRSLDMDKKAIQLEKLIQKHISEFQLHTTDYNNFAQKLDVRVSSLQVFSNQQKESLRDFINFNSVLNHIVIQDQIDRQRLALYALKPAKIQQQKFTTNIRLDQKCASCSDPNSSAIVNQAFKMACLAYNPSQIKIDSKVFTREQIFDISTGILERLKKRFSDIKQIEVEKKSKSLLQRSSQSKNDSSKNESYRTIDSISKKKDKQSLFALPSLGNTTRRKFSHKNTSSVLH